MKVLNNKKQTKARQRDRFSEFSPQLINNQINKHKTKT